MTITDVSSLSSLQSAVSSASTNDIVQLVDGTYNNGGSFNLTTSASKVIVKAKNTQKAIITGSPISFSSPGIHFMNFDLQWSLSSGNYSTINTGANNCRFSHNKVRLGNGTGTQHWLIVKGNNCLVDHNDFGTKTTDGQMLLIGSGSATVTGTKAFANYFHDQSGGGETVRIGASDVAQVDFNTEFSYNRLENCKADTETITVKSSNNNIHHNYMLHCYSLSQRHGHNNKYNDNILVDGAFRLNGYGHTVMRNQVIEGTGSQLVGHCTILNGDQEDDDGTAGQTVASHAHYARTKNCTIKNNIFAGGSATNNVIFYLGYDGSHSFIPTGNIIQNNIITAATGTLGTQNNSALWSSNTVSGNILWATGSATVGTIPGTSQDPVLTQQADRTFNFNGGSPLSWDKDGRSLAVTEVGTIRSFI